VNPGSSSQEEALDTVRPLEQCEERELNLTDRLNGHKEGTGFIFPLNPGVPGLPDFEERFKPVGTKSRVVPQFHDSLIKIQGGPCL
jgi:hypothetical protein